jgi:hypothetical protein
VPLDAGDRIELANIPVRVAQRGNLTRVVEESVRIPRLGAEAELVGDVVTAVAVVVDVELSSKFEKFGPPAGSSKGM